MPFKSKFIATVLAGVFLQVFLTHPVDAQVNELGTRSLSISADGRYVTYVKEKRGNAGISAHADVTESPLYIRDLVSGKDQRVESGKLDTSMGPLPSFSSNGKWLAFYGVSGDYLRLMVWSLEQKKIVLESRSPVCASGSEFCRLNPPQWLGGDQAVLFISGMEPLWRPSSKDRDIVEELSGAVPSAAGVTVLSTAVDRRFESDSGPEPGDSGQSVDPPLQIVAVEIASGNEHVLASGTGFSGVQVSADRSIALVVATEPRLATDGGALFSTLYRLHLMVRGRSALQPLVKRVRLMQGRSISLAPSGRWAAYTNTSAEGGGNVFVVDMNSGKVRNLTAGLSLPVHPIQAVNPYATYGKFGTTQAAPVWTRDEKSVIVVRPTEQADEITPLCFDLWQVPLKGQKPAPLAMNEALSIEALANCVETRQPCVVGPQGLLVAKVRRMGQGTLDYVSVDPASGKVSVLESMGSMPIQRADRPSAVFDDASAESTLVAATDAPIAIGVDETVNSPPDLWVLDVGGQNGARNLRILNSGKIPPHGQLDRIVWKSRNGKQLGALLHLPPDLAPAERVPVIMVVYPWMSFSRGGFSLFDGGSNYWGKFRTQGRYAILIPDLPVSVGTSSACGEFTDNVVSALDAVGEHGNVDISKAGIVGHSYGGYVVNCVVTHTDRFKAAISDSGVSDWTSMALLDNSGHGAGAGLKFFEKPWEAPERYLEESAVYHLDKVKTPLLITYGKTDRAARNQSIEMYYGLSVLDRPVMLAGYDDVGHGGAFGTEDFWKRALRWFSVYLKGE